MQKQNKLDGSKYHLALLEAWFFSRPFASQHWTFEGLLALRGIDAILEQIAHPKSL